jgi:hypothetical protein
MKPDDGEAAMSDTAVTRPLSPTPPLASRDYRDPTTLTKWVKGLLVLSLVVDLVATLSGALEFALLRSISGGTAEGDIETLANANDARQMAIGIAQLAAYIVTGIVFLVWIYRANRNARALGAQGMRFTPGWSVGWYFVPIMSLWRPFQAMREIWQASAEPGNWRAVQSPPLLGWWWAFYLGNQILSQVAYRLSDNVHDMDSALTASVVMTASSATGLPLDILGLLLVAKIAANQVWQAKISEVF